MKSNKHISISGIVQGVGFRPFIFQLASCYKLKGFVQNNTSGVYIEIEGCSSSINEFLEIFPQKLPKSARIDSIKITDGIYKSYKSFEIINSKNTQEKKAIISPDIGICDECLKEMSSKSNRRFNYPLINCTQCGPRYSIINSLPYDRKNTSMSFFDMCQSCYSEYSDPSNRRYHAQAISCYNCGPTLKLYDSVGELLSTGSQTISLLSEYLKDGCIVAVKGIGGFHLMCDATNKKAVADLRNKKNRYKKPFAVMFKNLTSAQKYIKHNTVEAQLLESKEKPIVLVEKKKNISIVDNVAPDINRLGVMLAYTPVQHLIFNNISFPLVATSANKSDEPIFRSFEEIQENLNNVVDVILDVNRDIVSTVDDSVLQVIEGKIQTMRLGRGYAPMSIPLNFTTSKKLIAVGAQQKSTIALALNDSIVLSPHIGDLSSVDSFEYFQRTIKTLKNFYSFIPKQIIHDMHPGYMSTKWAKEQGTQSLQIQHHYAHVLACMIEHNLDEKVLAFSFDGTGFGEDGTLWGAEVMICDYKNYERIGYMKPLPLLGGDKAIQEPKRMALSILFECYDYGKLKTFNLPLFAEFTQKEIEVLYQVWNKNLNSPLTSSMGRLFDIVASLMGILQKSDYEGQSGLLLESLCYDENAKIFSYEINEGIIDINPMIYEIVDLVLRSDTCDIPDRFINTLVSMMDNFANNYLELPIIFSGGVFQNKILLQRAIRHFKSKERRYYTQEKTAINDGGIALGQLAFGIKN